MTLDLVTPVERNNYSMNDCCVTHGSLAKHFGVSKASIQTMIQKELHIRKFFTRLAPRLLTVEMRRAHLFRLKCARIVYSQARQTSHKKEA